MDLNKNNNNKLFKDILNNIYLRNYIFNLVYKVNRSLFNRDSYEKFDENGLPRHNVKVDVQYYRYYQLFSKPCFLARLGRNYLELLKQSLDLEEQRISGYQWTPDGKPYCLHLSSIAKSAVSSGCIDTLRYLHSRYSHIFGVFIYSLKEALTTNNLEILQYLFENRLLLKSLVLNEEKSSLSSIVVRCLEKYSRPISFEIFQYLFGKMIPTACRNNNNNNNNNYSSNNSIRVEDLIVDKVLISKDIEKIRYLYHLGYRFTKESMILASEHYGSLEIVQFLFYNCIDCQLDNRVIENLAESGHLEVIRFLMDTIHPKTQTILVSDSPTAMCNAVKNGHLNVLEFFISKSSLSSNYKFEIDKPANLEVLKYLYEKQPERVKISINTIQYAASRNDIELLDYLYELEPSLFSKEILYYDLDIQLDTYLYMRNTLHFSGADQYKLFKLALRYHNYELGDWILDNNRDMDIGKLIQDLTFSMYVYTIEDLMWLHFKFGLNNYLSSYHIKFIRSFNCLKYLIETVGLVQPVDFFTNSIIAANGSLESIDYLVKRIDYQVEQSVKLKEYLRFALQNHFNVYQYFADNFDIVEFNEINVIGLFSGEGSLEKLKYLQSKRGVLSTRISLDKHFDSAPDFIETLMFLDKKQVVKYQPSSLMYSYSHGIDVLRFVYFNNKRNQSMPMTTTNLLDSVMSHGDPVVIEFLLRNIKDTEQTKNKQKLKQYKEKLLIQSKR
ncbi:hypothetical protein PPL_10905 [Heterostelium album PN500]|uniref:Ankyrin repeat-containing protein n=1 Tax=Heterostelium pallidum (strain ATCC 26659 / Pp 5 / PN500) TaxID=670386 RepID=D3BSD8_HETP5|nr:hypothetical protein PPL_10905 [Heterostelium album PN500]EFA75644.1 hypothetical protein PPL_10905 [Heterostelium album PN500]|eukprot:XP_020427778.1 hypothetical protein PPL_10905 [Heterostelium album PN500]